MGLEAAVLRAFAPDGPLSGSVANYKFRSGQLEMAGEVAATLTQGGMLVVEAGTGIGKTYAYLVPALLSGARILVSTATKSLQDQLFSRDIPDLLRSLGLACRISLLKGRGNYLCLHRLENAGADVSTCSLATLRDLQRVRLWATVTQLGDLAELDGLDENSMAIPMVTSTRDNCLASRCPRLTDCHLYRARQRAMVADVIVINHHLFFADVCVRESGFPELLPSVASVVFDEAHQLNDVGIQFLGRELSTATLMAFCRDLRSVTSRWVPRIADWHLLVLDIGHAVGELNRICSHLKWGERYAWTTEAPDTIALEEWSSAMAELQRVLQGVEVICRGVEWASPELQTLRLRASDLMSEVAYFSGSSCSDVARWLVRGAQIQMVEVPLNISQGMREQVFIANDDLKLRQSWIFTSATLGGRADIQWFLQACGLERAKLAYIESPFNYSAQAALYIPAHMPHPSDPDHSACVAMLVAEAVEILGGRALVLTTNLLAMRLIGQALKIYFSKWSPLEVLVQGEAGKTELLSRFRSAGQCLNSGCILIATASFWQGVDLPGEALQLVVIDKLPFSPPTDPLLRARALALKKLKKNVFKNLILPQAIISLKQGAGRLIRSESDQGILVVCDTRLNQAAYGKRMIAELPPMRQLVSPAEFHHALVRLTKPSTMDPDFF